MPIITTTSYCVYFCTKSKGTIWSCGYLYVVILWFYWSGPWDPMWRYVAPELKWVGLPWIIGNISLNFDIKFPQFVQKNQMKSNEQCFQITTLIAITLHSCPAIHFRNLFLTNIHFTRKIVEWFSAFTKSEFDHQACKHSIKCPPLNSKSLTYF